MIEKLKKKIFFFVLTSLSIIVVGAINIFAILNYNNTIRTATIMIDRITRVEEPKEPEPKEPELEDPDAPEPKELEPKEGKGPERRLKEEILAQNIEGIYNIRIENDEITEKIPENLDETISKYALKIAKTKKENGIIGNYIYNVKRRNNKYCDITLMENEKAITHAKLILISSAIFSCISIILIYMFSKKLSKHIVKPVEQTFEKQKQFISDASHELKTPLAVIEANADVLENEVKDNKWIKYIQNEIESMNKLINELLMLAKMENIDNIKEVKEIDLSKEVEIISSMFESMAYEKKVKIENKIKANIKIKANKEDIEHILSTLLDNAINHTKEKNKVIIKLEKTKNNIILQVKNKGEKIPEEEREKIFERFYRVDKSRNRKQKRYGLGLAIAKSTVEKYKGKIEVSYKEGFTIFQVNIPLKGNT